MKPIHRMHDAQIRFARRFGQVVHSSTTDPKQAGLPADTQFVSTVNHLSALSNPALVSAPLKKSISSAC